LRIPPKGRPNISSATFIHYFDHFGGLLKLIFGKKKKILRKKEENVNLTKKVCRIRTHLKTKLKQFTLLKLLLSIIALLADLIKREQYKLKMKDCLYKVFFLSQRSLQGSKISENH
jgi:hypothetical protein